MRDIRNGSAAVLVGVLAVLGVVLAAFSLGSTRANADDAAGATSKPETVVMVGSGAVAGVPDELSFTVGVSATEPDVSTAMQASNATMARVLASLDRLGVKKRDTKTTGLSIDPVYDYTYSNPRLTGYAVHQRVRVTFADLTKAGSAMTAVVRAGGNDVRIGGVSLDIADRDALIAQARKAAIKDATAKAGEYADAAGRHLGQVMSIREVSTRAPQPQVVAGLAGLYDRAAAAQPVPIRAGRQDLAVKVRVVWSLG